ncbi:MAG: AAA family ATPase, partial [Bacteroidetes bacterium]
MQILPTGEQSFLKIRQNNLLYVDKTEYAYRLIESNPFCFLSRPRRFGKSLFLSMLKEIFLGKKHLFEGLFIYDKIDWQEYPVIFMDFSLMDFKSLGLENAIHQRLDEIAQYYAIEFTKDSMGSKFKELLGKLHEKTGQQVVILIDEYDKPITEYLEDKQKASAQRDILKTFYSIIKGSSEHIRFFFLTGISRFSKVSIFSDLNNLTDLTFHEEYNTICGYTPQELEAYFGERMEKAAQ